MKTADELFGNLSDSDDYDTDEALQKARSKKPTMSRLKKKKIIPDADSDSSDSESEDDEKKREKKVRLLITRVRINHARSGFEDAIIVNLRAFSARRRSATFRVANLTH